MMASFLVSTACAATIMGLVLSAFEGTSSIHFYRYYQFQLASPQAHANLIPGFPFCIPSNVEEYFYTFWIPIIAFESLLCGMALFRGFQAFSYRHTLFKSGRHLVSILLRDSIVYYLMWVCPNFHALLAINVLPPRIFVAYLANLLVWSTNQVSRHSSLAELHIDCSSDRYHRNPCWLHHRHVLRDGQSADTQRPSHEAWNGSEYRWPREKYTTPAIHVRSGRGGISEQGRLCEQSIPALKHRVTNITSWFWVAGVEWAVTEYS